MISVFDMVENIVRKEEKCWLPAFFLLFPQCFQNRLCQGRTNLGLCGKDLRIFFIFFLFLKIMLLTLSQTSPGF